MSEPNMPDAFTLKIKRHGSLFVVSCDEVPGFLHTGRDLASTLAECPAALAEMAVAKDSLAASEP